ncbi:hypothetical protein SEUCBS139899_006738 [Sporothrix eucalyptigena]|uniref:Uncharacterized protein n=1 Tax=Sporothrix eucalyptigena TaxID=1812306 RepID=A0ABP0CHB6_9PEZI
MSAPAGDPSAAKSGENYTDLLDRESQLIAQYTQHASALVMAATARVSNRSTIGEAAANRLRIDAEVAGLVRTAENICTLTRRIRELWMVGALRASGEGEAEAEQEIRKSVEPLATQLTEMQGQRRTRNLGAYGTYVTTATGGPVPPGGQQSQQQASSQATVSQAQATSQATEGA